MFTNSPVDSVLQNVNAPETGELEAARLMPQQGGADRVGLFITVQADVDTAITATLQPVLGLRSASGEETQYACPEAEVAVTGTTGADGCYREYREISLPAPYGWGLRVTTLTGAGAKVGVMAGRGSSIGPLHG